MEEVKLEWKTDGCWKSKIESISMKNKSNSYQFDHISKTINYTAITKNIEGLFDFSFIMNKLSDFIGEENRVFCKTITIRSLHLSI